MKGIDFFQHKVAAGKKRLLALVVLSALFGLCLSLQPVVTVAVLSAAIRHATPLLLGALCGTLCERSGVMNIGIEGQMLFSAFCGFWVYALFDNLALGITAGVAAGAATGLLLAFLSVTLLVDQIIAGTVINMMAIGISGYFYPTGLSAVRKIQALTFPGLSTLPGVGPLFVLSPIVLISMVLVGLLHYGLFFTTWGLRMRAVGEHPLAADTLGIHVAKSRYIATMCGGMLAGLAGIYLSLDAVGIFERGMTNGRGFIALAVMIFGKWRPFGVWGASLVFGLAMAAQTQLQFAGIWAIPHQFVGMLPYLVTVVILAFFVGRSRPPASLGIPYEKA